MSTITGLITGVWALVTSVLILWNRSRLGAALDVLFGNKVAVPAEEGVPADLPDWARGELVHLRLENHDLERRYLATLPRAAAFQYISSRSERRRARGAPGWKP